MNDRARDNLLTATEPVAVSDSMRSWLKEQGAFGKTLVASFGPAGTPNVCPRAMLQDVVRTRTGARSYAVLSALAMAASIQFAMNGAPGQPVPASSSPDGEPSPHAGDGHDEARALAAHLIDQLPDGPILYAAFATVADALRNFMPGPVGGAK